MARGGAMVHGRHGGERAGRHARPDPGVDAAWRVYWPDASYRPAVAKPVAASFIGAVHLVFPRYAATGATAVLVQHVDTIPTRGAGDPVRPRIHELEYQ